VAVKTEPAVSGQIGPIDGAVGAPLVVKRQTPTDERIRVAAHVLDPGAGNMGRTSCSPCQAASDCAANFVAAQHDDVASPIPVSGRLKAASSESQVASAI
jgi:hypothetical protein